MSKFIKKFVTALWAILLVTMFALLVAFGVTQIPAAQRFAAHKVAGALSESLGVPVSVERLRYVPFTTIEVAGVVVCDTDSVPMIAARRIKADVSVLPALEGKFDLRELDADSLSLFLARRPDGTLNIMALATGDGPTPDFAIRRINVKRCEVIYDGGKAKPLVFENLKIDARQMHMSDDGFGISVSDVSFYNPDWQAHASLGGDFQMTGDTIRAGRAHASLGGCYATVDTALAVIDSAGLQMARVEIPSVLFNGYTVSRLYGRDVPAVNLALSAAYEYNSLNLNHLRLSVGESTFAEAKGVAKLDFDGLRPKFERAKATVSGRFGLSDFKAFANPDAEWPDVPLLPFEGSLEATTANASASLTVNSQMGSARLYANAASTDNWATSDFNTEIETDLTPQNSLAGRLTRLVANAEADGRISLTKQGEDRLSNTQFRGNVDRVEIGDLALGGIFFHGVANGSDVGFGLKMDDPLGHVDLNAWTEWGGVSPYVSLRTSVDSLRLGAISPKTFPTESMFCGGVHVVTTGLDMRTSITTVTLDSVFLTSDSSWASLKELEAKLDYADDGRRQLTLTSDVLRGEAQGDFDVAGLVFELREQARRVMPSLIAAPEKRRRGPVFLDGQLADFEVEVFNADSLINFFVPQLHVPDTVSCRGQVDSQSKMSWARVDMGRLAYGGFSFSGLGASLVGNDGKANVSVLANSIDLPFVGLMPNLNIDVSAQNDALTTDFQWLRKNESKNKVDSAYLTMDAQVSRGDDGQKSWRVGIDNSYLPLFDGSWKVDSCRMTFADSRIDVGNFFAFSADHTVRAYGIASASPADTMWLKLNNIVIEDALQLDESAKYSLAGNLSLCVASSALLGSPSLAFNAGIDRFFVNGDNLEHLDLAADYEAGADSVMVDLAIVTGGQRRAVVDDGYYSLSADYLNLPFKIDSLSTGFLNFYLDNCIDSWKGSTSGCLALYGPLSNIKLDARLKMNADNSFRVKQTNVKYFLLQNDSVILSPKSMDFMDIRFSDANGAKGIFGGCIRHDMFSNLDHYLEFNIRDNMLLLKTTDKDSPTYYGTVYGAGSMGITGPTTNIDIQIDATTGAGTQFSVVPNAKDVSSDPENFRNKADSTKQFDLAEILGTGTTATLKVHVNPQAELIVVVNAQTENVLRGRGAGDLEVKIGRTGELTMGGTYTVESGVYNFVLGIFDKKFTIDQGGTITWNGGAYDALIDITATQVVRASLYNLVGGMSYDGSSDLKRRVPVECKIKLTDYLKKPHTEIDIRLDSSQGFSQKQFDMYVNTPEEVNRQFLSLMLSGQFYPIQENSQGNQSSAYASQIGSELFSSKISSAISKNGKVDIGVNYQRGDETSNEEYGASFSTQAFNNRVSLSGNIGYGRDATANSNDDGSVIGDFDVEYKINKRGNIKAKAYTHSNNDVIYETSPTTQGIGISFQEEFDSFGDLIRTYWRKIFHRRHAEAEEQNSGEGEAVVEEAEE